MIQCPQYLLFKVTAAKGAENFYQISSNAVRIEGIEQARERDNKAIQVSNTIVIYMTLVL